MNKTYIIRFPDNCIQVYYSKQSMADFQKGAIQYEVNSDTHIETIAEFYARNWNHPDLKDTKETR
jgi:hypothetical protein